MNATPHQNQDLPNDGSNPNNRSLLGGWGVATKDRAVLLPVNKRKV